MGLFDAIKGILIPILKHFGDGKEGKLLVLFLQHITFRPHIMISIILRHTNLRY